METVVFLFIWFVAVPLAAGRIARDVTEEKIFAGLMAWIDARFRGTKIAYLARCPVCFSHWVVLGTAAGFWRCWLDLPVPLWCLPAAIVICIFASIELTTRLAS